MRVYSLKQFFHRSQNLRQAVVILFITVLISNVLGLLRNVIIANRVGVTYGSIGPLDNYFAAFTIPDLLYTLLIVGALSSAILPLLVQLDSENNEQNFWKTYNTLLSIGITLVIFGLIGLYFILPKIIPLIFTGFTSDEIETTTLLAQVLLFSPLFFTVSQFSSSALQAKRRFLAPAIAPIIYNLSIIASALFIPQFGLYILVLGVIVGAVAHLLVQVPSLINLGWRFRFILDFSNQKVRQVFKLMIPRTIALTGAQMMLIIFYQMASHFKDGSIAIYRLTDDLQTAPVLLLANSLAMAILPEFARKFAKNEREEMVDLVSKAVRLLFYLFLPLTIFILIFRQEIVSLYIAVGHGIKESEISLAALTLGFFAVSLIFQAIVLILVRAYFAQNNTIKPMFCTLFSLGISWLVAVIISNTTDLGVAGLSLAFSVGATVNALLLWFGLKIPLKNITVSPDGRANLLLICLGCLFSLVGFIFGKNLSLSLFDPLIVGQSFSKLVTAGMGFVVGFGIYAFWSKIVSIEQWQLIINRKVSTKN